MRKIFFTLIITFVMLFTSYSLAATKQDVINAINATYPVGDSSYRLPQSVIDKGVNAVNSKNLTSKQCDKILGIIGKAVAVAQRAGTTDITKVSKEDLEAGISILKEATGTAKIDLGISVPKIDVNENSNNSKQSVQEQTKTGEINAISGENQSGELKSGDLISGDDEDIFNILSFFTDTSGEEAIKIDKTVETHSTIAIIILILILFLNIFIIYLLFRSKWNKIAKCIVIIIFVILFLSTLCVLCVGLNYIEELKMIYKLYYMFK